MNQLIWVTAIGAALITATLNRKNLPPATENKSTVSLSASPKTRERNGLNCLMAKQLMAGKPMLRTALEAPGK